MGFLSNGVRHAIRNAPLTDEKKRALIKFYNGNKVDIQDPDSLIDKINGINTGNVAAAIRTEICKSAKKKCNTEGNNGLYDGVPDVPSDFKPEDVGLDFNGGAIKHRRTKHRKSSKRRKSSRRSQPSRARRRRSSKRRKSSRRRR